MWSSTRCAAPQENRNHRRGRRRSGRDRARRDDARRKQGQGRCRKRRWRSCPACDRLLCRSWARDGRQDDNRQWAPRAKRDQPVGVAGSGGKVVRILVDAGSWVRAGQVLAVIDRSVQAEQSAQLAAQVDAAKANAALAQSNYERAQALEGRGFVSKAEIDSKKATRDAANAQVRVAQAQLAGTAPRSAGSMSRRRPPALSSPQRRARPDRRPRIRRAFPDRRRRCDGGPRATRPTGHRVHSCRNAGPGHPRRIAQSVLPGPCGRCRRSLIRSRASAKCGSRFPTTPPPVRAVMPRFGSPPGRPRRRCFRKAPCSATSRAITFTSSRQQRGRAPRHHHRHCHRTGVTIAQGLSARSAWSFGRSVPQSWPEGAAAPRTESQALSSAVKAMNFRNVSSWCIRNPVFPIVLFTG